MKALCKNKYWEINEEYNIDKILYLLIDRPDYISFATFFHWKNKKGQHRDYDLPAYVSSKHSIIGWYNHGNSHRESNRPSIILKNGIKKYYINNKFIKEEK